MSQTSTVGSDNPYLLTLPQLLSAKKKLGRVAAYYDPAKTSFKGFESQALDPTEFREQLRRTFQIQLTNAELGALVVLFDKDGDGTVSSTEFVNEFFRLGKQERDKHFLKHKEEVHRLDMWRMKLKSEKEKRLMQLTTYKLPSEWTPEEEESALNKFKHIAFCHDSSKNYTLQGFINGGSMTAVEFKEQLKRNFGVLLTPGEVAALMHTFDENKDGTIDCHEFLYQFFRLGREQRDAYHLKKIEMTEKLRKKEKTRLEKINKHYDDLAAVRVGTATKKDRKTALNLMRYAALTYEKNPDWGFSAFDAKILTPTAFREQLKQLFLIQLTPGQLAAMLEEFGDGEGNIDTYSFLTTFYRMGIKEKIKVNDAHASRRYIINKEKEDFEKSVQERAISKRCTRIEWPKLPTSAGFVSGSFESYQGSLGSLDEGSSIDFGTDSLESAGPRTMPSLSRGYSPQSSGQSRRTMRKPSVLDSIAPNREALMMLSSQSSLASLYPNASDSTKDFIRQIEAEEEKLKHMKYRKRKPRRRSKSQADHKSGKSVPEAFEDTNTA